MSDLETRPSENADRLELPEMHRRGFFDDVPTLGRDFFMEPEPEESAEPFETNAPYETADAQHIVAAIDRLTEQLRLANLIAWQLGTAENYEREIRKGLDL